MKKSGGRHYWLILAIALPQISDKHVYDSTLPLIKTKPIEKQQGRRQEGPRGPAPSPPVDMFSPPNQQAYSFEDSGFRA